MALGALETVDSFGMGLLGAVEEATGLSTGLKARDRAEERSFARAKQERGNQAWIESMNYEDQGAYVDKTKALGTETGLGNEKIARIAARVNLALSDRAKNRNWFQHNAQIGEEGYDDLDTALAAEGVDLSTLSESQRKSVLALGGVGVGTYTGNQEATAGREGGGEQVRTQQNRVDNFKRELVDTTDEMYGAKEEELLDFGGTQSSRDKLTSKIFGSGRTGKGAMLLALRERGKTDPEAQKAYLEARGKAEKGDLREMALLEKEGVHEEFQGELGQLGASYVDRADTFEGRVKLTTEWNADIKGAKRDKIEAEGLSRAFGKQTAAGQTIGELLQGDIESISDPGMQELARKYQATQDPTKRASIEKEASELGMKLGTNTDSSLFGGLMAAAENPIKAIAGALAGSEQNISQAFPAAVDRFKTASETLLDAAQALLKKSGRTDLQPDTGG